MTMQIGIRKGGRPMVSKNNRHPKKARNTAETMLKSLTLAGLAALATSLPASAQKANNGKGNQSEVTDPFVEELINLSSLIF